MNHVFVILAVALLVSSFELAKAQNIPVKVVVLEALSSKDTTSSEVFRRDFEESLAIATKLAGSNLRSCGYDLKTTVNFFDASDDLQAHEKASEAEASGTWLIVGPRRSNHYILVAKGAPNTLTVSLMASSSDVGSLGPIHLSAYPMNAKLAQDAGRYWVQNYPDLPKYGYFTLLSTDCLNCRDFSNAFDSWAKSNRISKVGQHTVFGEQMDLNTILRRIEILKPKYVFLPNYSRVSSTLMGEVHAHFPTIQFIGGDGWGDQKFGFVDRCSLTKFASGVCVRGFPPPGTAIALLKLRVSSLVKKEREFLTHMSGPGLALLRVFQSLTEILCSKKPRTLETFKTLVPAQGAKYFGPIWGVSGYKLQDGRIHFDRIISSH